MDTAKIAEQTLNIAEVDMHKVDTGELEATWTVEEETKVRHKLDWQIVPMVTILYLMCFLDR